MKRDVLTIGLIVLVIGLSLWLGILRSLDPVYELTEGERVTVAVFEIAGMMITFIGIPFLYAPHELTPIFYCKELSSLLRNSMEADNLSLRTFEPTLYELHIHN